MEEHHDNSIVCILGGTGFIGRYLLELLVKEPSANIKVLSRNKNRLEYDSENIRVIEGTLLDVDSLVRFLEPDAIVINLAFLDNQPPEVNIKAIQNLARACVEVGVARLIHCSTAVVVGRVKDDVITEDTFCLPVTTYEKTKLAIENMLFEDFKDKCEVVIVRPTAVFGVGGKNLLKHADDLVTESRLIRMIKTSLYSKRKINLVCVENVVGAILFLSHYRDNISGQCYIVSDDDADENNYYDVVRLLAQHLGLSQIRSIYFPFQPFILSGLLRMFRRTNTNTKRIYSSEKLVRLGFKKPIFFQDGIKRFASWYKNEKLSKVSGTV